VARKPYLSVDSKPSHPVLVRDRPFNSFPNSHHDYARGGERPTSSGKVLPECQSKERAKFGPRKLTNEQENKI